VAYTIAQAQRADIFASIQVATDDLEIADVALRYGATVHHRPPAAADERDIDWLWPWAQAHHTTGDAAAILRPTSPFRKADTIRAAWARFRIAVGPDSLRAMRPVTEHPGKMWRRCLDGDRVVPLLPFEEGGAPWHSNPTGNLPDVYVQTASLEIVWMGVLLQQRSLSGSAVMPYLVGARDAFDLNTPDDWDLAEWHLSHGWALPEVSCPA